jgi:hypothetical protein
MGEQCPVSKDRSDLQDLAVGTPGHFMMVREFPNISGLKMKVRMISTWQRHRRGRASITF